MMDLIIAIFIFISVITGIGILFRRNIQKRYQHWINIAEELDLTFHKAKWKIGVYRMVLRGPYEAMSSSSFSASDDEYTDRKFCTTFRISSAIFPIISLACSRKFFSAYRTRCLLEIASQLVAPT